MLAAARARTSITYSELVEKITALTYKPYDKALANLLSDVSRKTYKKGRGLLSAVGVHAGGDELPGDGFFELAEQLGLHFDDRKVFWREQVEAVYTSHNA